MYGGLELIYKDLHPGSKQSGWLKAGVRQVTQVNSNYACGYFKRNSGRE